MRVAAGKNEWWLQQKGDAITYGISREVSGFLLQELARASGHCDAQVAELFRQGSTGSTCQAPPLPLPLHVTGAPMLGQLDCSGVGTALEVDAPKDEQALKKTCAQNNEALLRQLREVGCCTAIACHHRAVWAG